MLPAVTKLLSLDVYRDGGSLSVSFSDASDTQHELMFVIESTRNGKEPIRKYKSAVIVSFIKSEYVSPITSLTSEMTNSKEDSIEWKEAVTLLNQIQPFISAFQSDYLWVYESMVEIASNEKHEIKYP